MLFEAKRKAPVQLHGFFCVRQVSLDAAHKVFCVRTAKSHCQSLTWRKLYAVGFVTV